MHQSHEWSRSKRISRAFGAFCALSSVVEWYLDVPQSFSALSPLEEYRYQQFLERPHQILRPPDLTTHWWLVLIFAASVYFLVQKSTEAFLEIHQAKLLSCRSFSDKVFCFAALLTGGPTGYLVLAGAFWFPVLLRCYVAVAASIFAFMITFLVVRYPYRLYRQHTRNRFKGTAE